MPTDHTSKIINDLLDDLDADSTTIHGKLKSYLASKKVVSKASHLIDYFWCFCSDNKLSTTTFWDSLKAILYFSCDSHLNGEERGLFLWLWLITSNFSIHNPSFWLPLALKNNSISYSKKIFLRVKPIINHL